jgi:DNA-directed RNA polymerase specialized sigma24 family protein
VKGDPRVKVLRELLRHWEEWRTLFETYGLELIPCPDGSEWSFWDVKYLIDEAVPLLPMRQRQAIDLCLVKNLRERDVAVLMGIDPENPVAMYATTGLESIFEMIDEGWLPRLQPEAAWTRYRSEVA